MFKIFFKVFDILNPVINLEVVLDSNVPKSERKFYGWRNFLKKGAI